MSSRCILLVGAGGHARACIDVMELEGRFEVAGLIGLPEEVGQRVLDYPVLFGDEELERLVEKYPRAMVTVGQIRTPSPRIRLFESLVGYGYELPTCVSPLAHVSRHASIGRGTIVMHGAIVNAGAVVGENCIINNQALVEHDVVIGNHCHISTGASVNSGVRVGDGTFVGSQASVRQGIVIGERCVVGMGQVVLADCDPGTQRPARRS